MVFAWVKIRRSFAKSHLINVLIVHIVPRSVDIQCLRGEIRDAVLKHR